MFLCECFFFFGGGGEGAVFDVTFGGEVIQDSGDSLDKTREFWLDGSRNTFTIFQQVPFQYT